MKLSRFADHLYQHCCDRKRKSGVKVYCSERTHGSAIKVKGKCWDYSPIVQRPYGLGVANTVLCICRHRQVCVLDLGL